ncbi:MAG: hypothetical protein LRY53_03940 [Burkholderiaceae bacterium]|nr:hypothetical protein [Burkholderiaceae bacterium]MCD8516629.1 hypothetical protein [Burkholderiaceae bacterium]MCD8537943.1 hypothetical protein [Burkholderiaceae bacterium]MCD8564797.1 hypothetical protein [Burkholderiaceae bacterium]
MLESLTAREKVQAIYIAYLLSLVVMPLAIVGVFFAYKMRQEHRGSWLESHCNWQIQTFWIGSVAFLVGAVTAMLFVGYLIIPIAGLWFLYRIIKGWLKLSENQTVAPKAYGLI